MNLTTTVSAVIQKYVPQDLFVSTTAESPDVPGHHGPVELMHVHYRSGNEFLRLTEIIDDLRKLGKVEVNYYGRGVEHETPRLVFEVVDSNRKAVAVHWHLT